MRTRQASGSPSHSGPCPCTHKSYKLHPSDAREIRKLHRSPAWTNNQIALVFSISSSHVANIGVGRFWKEI